MPIALVVRLTFWLWFAAAVLVGQQQVLQRLPAPATPVILLGLTALLLVTYFRVAALRDWVDGLDLRSLALIHVSRFVGIYFLVLYRQGKLPYAFAVPGGIGDILVATLVLPVVFLPVGNERRLRLLTIWNVIGFIDIMLVVLTAIRLNVADPFQLRAMRFLPLSLLPTFLVPLIIATHIVIFVRLARVRHNG